MGTFFSHVIPQPLIEKVSRRFDTTEMDERSKNTVNPPMFDVVRASVNMMVASILIAVGTSYKLPLSTTYVTFIVAMSTSLVDGAWGRDSAVYRITGVFTVIGGWFITGFAAFSAAFFLSLFMGWAQVFGVVAILTLAVFAFYRTNLVHKQREENFQENTDEIDVMSNATKMFENNKKAIKKNLITINDIFSETVNGLILEDRKALKKQLHISREMEYKLVAKKSKIYQIINSMPPDSIEASYFYILTLDYLRELAHNINFMAEPVFNHVDNNHKPIKSIRAEEMTRIAVELSGFIKMMVNGLDNESETYLEELNHEQTRIVGLIRDVRKNLIKAIKKHEVSTKNSLLLLNILSEARNILNYSITLMKIQSDFNNSMKSQIN